MLKRVEMNADEMRSLDADTRANRPDSIDNRLCPATRTTRANAGRRKTRRPQSNRL